MQHAYRDSDVTFACIAFYQSEDKSRAVAILRNSLGEISCDIFSFRDGKICAEEEFLLGRAETENKACPSGSFVL